MFGFLLDTSVVSALAPGKAPLAHDFAVWLQRHSDRLFLPAIAVAEIQQGICKLRRQGAAERAAALTRWLDGLMAGYAERILPLDGQAARLAGEISDRAMAGGHHPGFADVAIAAIAAERDLVLLTRNTRHFAPLGIPQADPFSEDGALPA